MHFKGQPNHEPLLQMHFQGGLGHHPPMQVHFQGTDDTNFLCESRYSKSDLYDVYIHSYLI
jgi:hypothetical protein